MLRDGLKIREEIFDANGLYSENDVILLRRIEDADREAYLDMYRAKSVWRYLIEDDIHTEDSLWDMYFIAENLNAVIIRKADNKFCGYCGLQGFATSDTPEISIELAAECQGRGIGTMVLPLLMKKFAELTGTKLFISRVSSENIASQKLMRKIGGVPAGVVPIPGSSEIVQKLLEEDDEPQPEWIPDLAAEFHTTPQKLRSHVLVFHHEIQ